MWPYVDFSEKHLDLNISQTTTRGIRTAPENCEILLARLNPQSTAALQLQRAAVVARGGGNIQDTRSKRQLSVVDSLDTDTQMQNEKALILALLLASAKGRPKTKGGGGGGGLFFIFVGSIKY